MTDSELILLETAWVPWAVFFWRDFMPSFSDQSLQRLGTCHPDLQRLFLEVIKDTDCAVLVGYRDAADQEVAFKAGKSKAQFGQSKHNSSPSLACDVMPWPINWDDAAGIKAFADKVKASADKLGIVVRWGGDFLHLSDRDHFELTNKLPGNP